MEKDKACAITNGILKTWVNKFIRPKSTRVFSRPTRINRAKRTFSFLGACAMQYLFLNIGDCCSETIFQCNFWLPAEQSFGFADIRLTASRVIPQAFQGLDNDAGGIFGEPINQLCERKNTNFIG